VVGALLSRFADHPTLFTLCNALERCAALDDALAIDFDQKSRLGGFLNEAGDILSDMVLFFPLVLVPPFSKTSIIPLIVLAVLCGLIGIFCSLMGSGQRLEGPLGKTDRAIVLSLLALGIAVCGGLPDRALVLAPILETGLFLTYWNRLSSALAEYRGEDLRQ
jgi:CDP-diacylglycerol--glycerol-3-phosphate 3-phosphatidyltransferase